MKHLMILSHIINSSISKYNNKNDRDADCKQQRQLMETISMETSEQQSVFWGKYYLKTDSLKAHLHLASTSAFAFSKIIEAMVTKHKCKEWVFIPFLYINVNITIDTMLKIDACAVANVNIDAQCERTLTENKISFNMRS